MNMASCRIFQDKAGTHLIVLEYIWNLYLDTPLNMSLEMLKDVFRVFSGQLPACVEV